MTKEQEFLLELKLDDKYHDRKLLEGYYTSELLRLYNERLVEMLEREIDLRIQGSNNESRIIQKYHTEIRALREKNKKLLEDKSA